MRLRLSAAVLALAAAAVARPAGAARVQLYSTQADCNGTTDGAPLAEAVGPSDGCLAFPDGFQIASASVKCTTPSTHAQVDVQTFPEEQCAGQGAGGINTNRGLDSCNVAGPYFFKVDCSYEETHGHDNAVEVVMITDNVENFPCRLPNDEGGADDLEIDTARITNGECGRLFDISGDANGAVSAQVNCERHERDSAWNATIRISDQVCSGGAQHFFQGSYDQCFDLYKFPSSFPSFGLEVRCGPGAEQAPQFSNGTFEVMVQQFDDSCGGSVISSFKADNGACVRPPHATASANNYRVQCTEQSADDALWRLTAYRPEDVNCSRTPIDSGDSHGADCFEAGFFENLVVNCDADGTGGGGGGGGGGHHNDSSKTGLIVGLGLGVAILAAAVVAVAVQRKQKAAARAEAAADWEAGTGGGAYTEVH